MQQEDDLRGLARVMDFMRAISILFVGINVYWFCYSTLKEWGVTFEVIDKIYGTSNAPPGCSRLSYGRNFFRWCSSPCRASALRA